MGKKKKAKKRKDRLSFHEEVVSRSRSRDSSSARAALADRIKAVQARDDYDPYSDQIDSTNEMLEREITETERMLAFLRTYDGEQPMLLRLKWKLTAHSGWVPSRRERTLFFSIIRSQGAEGSLRSLASKDYVRRLDSDGYDDDQYGADSLDPL